MKTLVTGGAGMIGSALVKRLVEQGTEVVVVDNLLRGKLEHLRYADGRGAIDLDKAFFTYDLRTSGAIDRLLTGVDHVYHLADVVGGIGYVFANQGSVFRDNLLINTNVIDSVRRARVKGFVYVGTACSFPAHLQSGVDARPLTELDQYPASPESAYGWSKLMGEYESFLMEQGTGIPVSVLTLHNVYGAPADFDSVTGQVIPSLIRKAVRWPNEPFVVWGSGNQGRAFVHVDDVVDALVLAGRHGLGKGVIQIGPSVCTSIREVAETVVRVSGKPIPIQYDVSKPEGDKGRCADYSKAKTLLGWEPRVGLELGLSSLYRWIAQRIRDDG
jgi:GDP-D-mannose 3',5'-epimerase